MIPLAVDENFDHHILRALLRRLPDLHVCTVAAAGRDQVFYVPLR